MIEANFDRSSRMSAVSGVYQYDTGQCLKMNGLPSPEEFLEGDSLITGDMVTVQVQFGRDGDDQTEARLAQWDDGAWSWMVDIPDEYLTRIDPVRVYVYVYHGEDGDSSRARTRYEGVFSPISRPAPNNTATEEMLETWAELKAEVDLVLSSAGTSVENVTNQGDATAQAATRTAAAATEAAAAADASQAAADRLGVVENRWKGMTVNTTTLAAGSTATASISGNTITLGIPRGANGGKGATGDVGPADIALSFSGGVLTITPK